MTLPLRHRLTNTANTGLALAVSGFRTPSLAQRGSPIMSARTLANSGAPSRDIIGIRWSISDWLQRGRTLNTDAVAFDNLIRSRLPVTSPTRASFFGWYDAWRPFYEKYIGPDAGNLAQANVSLNYEEFDQALLRQKQQFDRIVQDFRTQPEAAGTSFQPTPDRPDTGKDGSGLPWWFWLGTGAVLVGGGYLVYKKYQEGKAKLAYLDKHAPAIIDRFVPGGQGQTIAEYGRAGRDGFTDYEVVG